MKKYRIKVIFYFVLLFTTCLVACSSTDEIKEVDYQTVLPDQFLIGDIYRLQKHQIIRGNIAGIGTTLIIEEGALVDGNISLVGSRLVLAGRVTQDINLVAGTSEIRPSALVLGDVNRILQNSKIDPNANIFGEINDFRVPASLAQTIAGGVSNIFAWSQPDSWFILQIAQAIILICLALIATISHKSSSFVSNSLLSQPALSWLIGTIVYCLGSIIAIILILTICLSLGGLALLLFIFLGGAYGIGVLGSAIGDRIWMRFNFAHSQLLKSIFGGLILSFVISGFSLIPCLGAIINLGIISSGFGAVLLSLTNRFSSTR